MQMLLSSDAMPGASIEALREAAARRALAGLELTLDAGHGADATPCAARHGLGRACFAESPADVRTAWLRLPAEAPLALRAVWASAAAFTFATLERGPETWRVTVTPP